MIPKNIYVLRHGQSKGNIDWKHYLTVKDCDVELTPLGKLQAARTGIELAEKIGKSNCRIYSSHYTRAEHTASIILSMLDGGNCSHSIEESLRELKWMGDNVISNPKIQKDQRAHMLNFQSANEGGESALDVYQRVEKFINRLYTESLSDRFPENVIIVSHGIAIRVLLMRLLKWNFKTYETLENPRNCEVFHLQANSEFKFNLLTPFPLKK